MKSLVLAQEFGVPGRIGVDAGSALPRTPRQLRWMLARKLGTAAVGIGLLVGGASYLLEIHGAEKAALERAEDGARHFVSPAMQIANNAKASEEHAALNRLLDRSRLIGIRVFDTKKALIYETWADIPASLIEGARSRQHDWPGPDQSHRNWIDVSGERMIQVVLPLSGNDRMSAGYLEGVSRLDEQTLREQREKVRRGALTAVMSVLITAFVQYPLLLAMLERSAGLSRRLLESNLSLMRSLGNAVAKRDSDTDAHNYRVTLYAVAVAEAMGLSKLETSDLIAGAFLHDVGKIGIPDHILLKPGKLTDDEFETMKTHVLIGLEIVADNPWLEGAAQTIRHHHERFDGRGYPDGLRGDAIPRVARIFAVADVFDALTSVRPYKTAMTFAEAMGIIEGGAGRQFDSVVVAIFRKIIPEVHAKVSQAIEADLRRDLRNALCRYFKAEVDPGDGPRPCAA